VQIPWHLKSFCPLLIEETREKGVADRLPSAARCFDIRAPTEYTTSSRRLLGAWRCGSQSTARTRRTPAIAEWMSGTGPSARYLEKLRPGNRGPFLEDLSTRLTRAFPRRADGRVLYPFPRLFLLALA